ncbi:MAG: hypothetical protein WCJ66_13080 [Verrucomicrobiota bacterium]
MIKPCRPQRGPLAGSSLIEVLMAMGVLAVVLPLVFAVLARASQSYAEAQAETRCMSILPACMDEIEAAQLGKARFLPALPWGVPFPAPDTILALAFSRDGRLLGCVAPAAYLAGTHRLADESIRYLASLHTEPAPARPNMPAMLRLRITLEYPPAAPMAKRRHLGFYTSIQ